MAVAASARLPLYFGDGVHWRVICHAQVACIIGAPSISGSLTQPAPAGEPEGPAVEGRVNRGSVLAPPQRPTAPGWRCAAGPAYFQSGPTRSIVGGRSRGCVRGGADGLTHRTDPFVCRLPGLRSPAAIIAHVSLKPDASAVRRYGGRNDSVQTFVVRNCFKLRLGSYLDWRF